MAKTEIKAPGGQAASDFIQERFGIQWGPDVFGIAEDGFNVEQLPNSENGWFTLTLMGECTREDVERFVSLLWSKPKQEGNTND